MLRKSISITSPAFKALFTPELKKLYELFYRNNYELRMAGGAVRDLLMKLKPSDVDFASTATPTQMKAMFEKEGIRMLHKKGEEHGTITCRLNEKENFEITTLRIDVVCDGRRAEVQYTTDWALDAFRRDLTMNSLFLGLDGTIYDYTGGVDDINSRRISFVGDPELRLQEDYLRILRYFRFFGRISKDSKAHTTENIDAIVKCRDGLKNVSGERIWTELNKIFVGRFASDIIETMLSKCGLALFVGLNDKNGLENRLSEFRRVAMPNINKTSEKVNCEPATMLAALCENSDDIELFRRRAKISNAEFTLAQFIVANRVAASANHDNINYFKHLILDLLFDGGSEIKHIAQKHCAELLKYINAPMLLEEIEKWKVNVFPIHGLDLMVAGVEKGKRMRAVLKYLFELWKKNASKNENNRTVLGYGDKQELSVKAKDIRVRYPTNVLLIWPKHYEKVNVVKQTDPLPYNNWRRIGKVQKNTKQSFWPQNKVIFPKMKNTFSELTLGNMRRQKVVLPHYQRIFARAKPVEGTMYFSNNIDDFTGKLTHSARHKFSWRPNNDVNSIFFNSLLS